MEKILDVEGADVFFIGPNDLSISLGIPLEYTHPRYIEAVEYIVRTAEARGVAAGLECQTSETVDRQDKGSRFLVYSRTGARWARATAPP